MTSTTTGYLADGRRIEVPRSAVKDWRYEVENGDTVLGLGDWYTDCGEENLDMIEGEADDYPRCNHTEDDDADHPLNRVRVTNASQTGAYNPERPHASSWVCGRRACVLDAMAHVERFTGEQALWTFRTGATDDWRSLPPERDVVSSVFDDLSFPLSPETASGLGDLLTNEFVVRLPLDGLIEAACSVDLNQNVIAEDWIHPRVLAFGSPHDCSWQLLAVDGDTAVVRYSTDVAEALHQHRESPL